MFNVRIKINTIENVKEFVKIMTKQSFEADLIGDRYIVDAKSIMGIFSLDLTSPKELHIQTSDEDAFNKFKEEIKKFIV